jgi:hypothetical protein
MIFQMDFAEDFAAAQIAPVAIVIQLVFQTSSLIQKSHRAFAALDLRSFLLDLVKLEMLSHGALLKKLPTD